MVPSQEFLFPEGPKNFRFPGFSRAPIHLETKEQQLKNMPQMMRSVFYIFFLKMKASLVTWCLETPYNVYISYVCFFFSSISSLFLKHALKIIF